eukprot:3178328-Prymnesium_polylepis.1
MSSNAEQCATEALAALDLNATKDASPNAELTPTSTDAPASTESKKDSRGAATAATQDGPLPTAAITMRGGGRLGGTDEEGTKVVMRGGADFAFDVWNDIVKTEERQVTHRCQTASLRNGVRMEDGWDERAEGWDA